MQLLSKPLDVFSFAQIPLYHLDHIPQALARPYASQEVSPVFPNRIFKESLNVLSAVGDGWMYDIRKSIELGTLFPVLPKDPELYKRSEPNALQTSSGGKSIPARAHLGTVVAQPPNLEAGERILGFR